MKVRVDILCLYCQFAFSRGMAPQLIEQTVCEAQQTSKETYKAALSEVERIATLHSALFSVLVQIFLLVSCSYTCAFEYILCLVRLRTKT